MPDHTAIRRRLPRAFVLLLLTVPVLAACAGDDSAEGTSTTAATTAVTTRRKPTKEVVRLPVEVTPRARLRDGDVVQVSAPGFAPGDVVTVSLCETPGPGEALIGAACDGTSSTQSGTGAEGTATASVTVHETITTAAGEVSCRRGPNVCSVAVVSGGQRGRSGWAPIAFVESVLPPPPARIAISPATSLDDGTEVTVAGRHFPPGAAVEVLQCPADDDAGLCWTVSAGDVEAGPDGDFTTTVPVWRLLDGEPGQPVDCGATSGACVLLVNGEASTPSVGLEFDASRPSPAVPTLLVEPTDGLVDDQVVTVSGRGFTPGVGLLLEQCAVSDGGRSCVIEFSGGEGGNPQVEVEADGTFHAVLRLRRVLDVGTPVDCAATPGRCIVLADSYSFTDEAIQHPPVTPAGIAIAFVP